MKKVGWKEPYGSSGTRSSPHAPSPISMTSTLRPRPGAQAQPPIGPVQINPSRRSARCSTRKDRGCSRCRTTRRLAQAAPASQTLLMRAAERGANLGAITAGLLRLLERYGAAALQDAILEALVRNVPHPNAVRLVLERWREQNGGVPPVALVL